MLIVCSCVNDDSFFPETPGEDITSTIALVTILNDLNSKQDGTPESELCFRFEYPIVLGYNNDSSIRIDSYQGLIDVISSQSENFNISGLQFPVQVIFNNGDQRSIGVQDEKALLDVIKECELGTFRGDFDNLFRQCFKLEYPVTLRNGQKEEVRINNDEGFDRFLTDQGADYQPDFKFPVNTLIAPDFNRVSVSTYYEFYDKINNCVGCPEIPLEISPLGDNVYNIIPGFEVKDGYEITFKINDQIITDVVIDGRPFSRPFTPGIYSVCIKVIAPDCPKGKEVCKQIEVEPICPDLFFDFEKEQGTFTYIFSADFVGITEVSYDWFVDDQFIESDGGANGDNQLTFELDFGVRKICIKANETPNCPNGKEFCQEINVE